MHPGWPPPAAKLAARLLGVALALLLGPTSAFAVFGFTEATDYYTVDAGSTPSLVFKIRRTDNGVSTQSAGDIMSLVYNGVEYQDQTRGSQINSGFDFLGYPTSNVVVNAELVGTDFIKITVTTDGLTHYYMARKGYPHIYMGTHFTTEPVTGGGLCRYILRMLIGNLTNGPTPSDIRNTDQTIESGDIFGFSSANANTALIGQTRSKHYSGIRLKDWAYIGANNSATSPTAGLWMVRDNQEGASGGPFFKSLLNQGTSTNQEITYIVNYGEGQTEAFRTNILNSYTLVFTNGAPPGAVDTSWFSGMGLTGYVAPSGRGTVACAGISNRDASCVYTVGFANATAQYFTTASAVNGSFTMSGMIPGTYAMQVFKNEMAVYAASVTATAATIATIAPIAIAADPSGTVPLWRIGNWDGTPLEFLHGDKVTYMHPSDVRIVGTGGTASWNPGTYVIGTASPATGMPCYHWKDVNGTQAIQFNLTAGQIAASTVRVGMTVGYAGGRPNIQVNSWVAGLQAASTQPSTRTLTVGTYRGNNVTYTFSVPASALVVGTNTLYLGVISGSSGTAYLSPGYSLDCIDMYQGTAQTLAVPGAPTNLTASSGDTQVALNWSAVGGAASYNVLRATASGGPYATVATALAATGFTDTGLTNNTLYYYVVSANNSSGTGLASEEVAVAATPPGPPAAPTGLAATAYNASVSLTWNPSFNATGYKIKRSTTSGAGFTTLKTLTSASYSDFGLINGTTYYYVVSAVSALGEGPDSAQVEVTPSTGTTVALTSDGALDGYVTASTSANAVGGGVTASGVVRMGDTGGSTNSRNRQYKAFFSFDTSSLPDDANILSATLKLKRASLNGTNPFTAGLGTCQADIKGGTGFNGSTALEAADFQAAADATQVATMSDPGANGAFSTGALNAAGIGFLNKTGLTQFRVYFSTPTNNNNIGDFVSWNAGDDATAANRPVLEVTYAAGVAPSSLPIALLPFNETSGTTAADATGGGWTGTLANGPAWVAGKVNNAVSLNAAASQSVSLPAGVVGNLNDFTIAAWVNLNGVTNWSRLFDFGTGSTNYMFLTPANGSTGKVRFAIRTPPVAEQTIDGVASLSGGAWTHVAVSLSGATGKLYVNGTAVGTNAAMTLRPSSLGNTTLNYLGKSQFAADPYLNGAVDEFQIFNHALTPAEIALLATPPAAPAGFAVAVGDGQATLGWNAVSGTVTGYNVKRATTVGGPYATIASGVSGTGYADSNLVNGTTYYYLVSTLNGVAEGPNNSPLAATPLAVPAGVAVTTFNNAVTVSWSPAAGAASYRVKRATASGGPYATIANGVTATNYADATAVAGTAYSYVVSAVNPTGESPNSDPITVVASPTAPTGLAGQPGNAVVTLTWNAPAGAATYNVLRSEANGTGYSELAAGLTATTYQDAAVVNGVTYYYVVSAQNAGGESAWSTQARATPASPPISPQEQFGPGFTLSAGAATCTVRASVPGHAYRLQYCPDLSVGDWVTLDVPAQSGTGGNLQFTVAVDPAKPRGFYRVLVAAP